MKHSIRQPEKLLISDNGRTWFGGWQEWYTDRWRAMSGCGPTCSANIMAYLAGTRASLRALFPENAMTLPRFTGAMNELFEYVTPGAGGLNRPELFAAGVENYSAAHGAVLRPHLLETAGNREPERIELEEVAGFVARGLDDDCPVAFLNLSAGREKRLQSWHWITLVSLEVNGDAFIAEASDEGKNIGFDLRQWYQTTRMRGGFVWFSENSEV